VRFREQQEQARSATGVLLLLFALTVLFTVAGVNLALALVWRLQFGWLAGYPTGFFEINTAVTLGFVLGGAWLESLELQDGGAHVARMIGGHEVATPQSPVEKRLRNVVDEMAIATGLKPPRIFVLDREDAINALAAGWERDDSVIAVTRGALERLTRDELQGVVAHEFAHILNGDTRLNMRLIGMVYGLQMVSNFGRSLMNPVDDRGRRGPAVLIGLALVAAGSIGWLAGRLLKAGVSRQREYLADAYAVQFTRQPSGIGNALRKIANQLRRGQRMRHVNAEVVSHLLLSSDTLVNAGALATHPSIDERLRRIFGHAMAPLPDDPVTLLEAPAPELPPLDFTQAPAGVDAQAPTAELALAAEAGGIVAPSGEDALFALLPDTTMPAQLCAAVLACLVPPGADTERAAWRRAAGTSAASQDLLQVVQALPQRKRQPWFERLLQSSAALTPEQRAALRRDALAVVQADGKLSLHEYLQAQVLHRLLSAGREDLATEQRNLQTTDLAGPITTVSLALASLLPGADGLTWAQAVLQALGLPSPQQVAVPAVSELNQAIDRLALLGRMHRPALAKAWMEAMPGNTMPQTMADALRCLCLLIDTPLPPELAARFDPLPAPR
jgi:Zn-dependent protease with chaperone function